MTKPTNWHVRPGWLRSAWASVRIKQTYVCNTANLTYKALNNLTPEYESNTLKTVSQTHGLNLRSSENGDSLYVPLSRTTLYGGAFSCPKLWNSLPKSVKSCDTLNSFKNVLKLCPKRILLDIIFLSNFTPLLRQNIWRWSLTLHPFCTYLVSLLLWEQCSSSEGWWYAEKL